jgi:hypothetical protein
MKTFPNFGVFQWNWISPVEESRCCHTSAGGEGKVSMVSSFNISPILDSLATSTQTMNEYTQTFNSTISKYDFSFEKFHQFTVSDQ